MASNKKKLIIVILSLFAFVAFMVIGFGYIVVKGISNSIAEGERIENLPEVSGVIASNNNFIAPISGDSVAVYILEYRASYKSSKYDPSARSKTRYDSFLPSNHKMIVESGSGSYQLNVLPQTIINKDNNSLYKEWKVAFTLDFKGAPDLPPHLLGVDDEIDCIVAKAYKDNFDVDIGIDINCSNWDYLNIEIQEYAWRKGDSITIKGEISEGQINLLW